MERTDAGDNLTAHLMEGDKAMLEAGCRKLVFSSTCAIYGVSNQLPIRETTHTNLINPYAASKLMVKRIISSILPEPVRLTL